MTQKKVLIVDDEKNIRMTLSATLATIQLDTETAVNGEEALQKVEEKDYDLILLDIKMPGIDGMEVLERLRKIKPHIGVIMITAHGTIENAVEAMKLGAVDFLQKPFSPQEIRDIVTTVLERNKLVEGDIITYQEMMEFAKKSVQKGNFEKAIEFVRKAVSESPDRPEAFNFLGALMEIKEKEQEAQKFYRAALSLDPTYKPAKKNLNRTTSWKSKGKISFD